MLCSDQMEALKRQRASIKGRMTKILTFAQAVQATTDHEDIKLRVEKANILWTEFTKVEEQMFALDVAAESQIDTFDDTYYHAVALLNGSIRRFQLQEVTNPRNNGEVSFNTTMMETKLPKLYIPVFQGDCQEWQSFFDLFNSSVHDKISLSAAQKLQYLKSLLRGEPLGLIKHLNVTEANYIEAYQILIKRYDRKKATINSYIDTFIHMPAISRVNSSNIRKLASTTEEMIRGLKAIGTQGEARDPWLIHILVNKLDDESRRFWQHHSAKIDYPTLQEFIDCLLIRADTIEGIRDVLCKPTPPAVTSVRRSHTVTPLSTVLCSLCNIEHFLYQCPKFREMSINDRRSYIQKTSRCYNCLSDTHQVQTCRSKRSCHICRKRHNSLLHLPNTSNPCTSAHSVNTIDVGPHRALSTTSPSYEHRSSFDIPHDTAFNKSSSNIASSAPTQLTNASSTTQVDPIVHCQLHPVRNNDQSVIPEPTSQKYQTILPTALVHIKNHLGAMHECRVLLDSGSQASFVSEACIRRLSSPTQRVNIKVTGVGASTAGTVKRATSLDIYPRSQFNHRLTIQALILPQITLPLPSASFYPQDWEHLKSLQLADPKYHETSPIDLLIGSDHFFDIIIDGKKIGSNGTPIAQNSIFGWVIVGNINQGSQSSCSTLTISEVDINSSLQKFWETEELPTSKHLSPEEEQCEKQFELTHTRALDGRFGVNLPFKSTKGQLGNSVQTAIRRFMSIENRMQTDSNFRDEYITFMRDYIKLGHMERIPLGEITIDSKRSFYLPHHAVTKPSSTTTKTRVVFDASSKTSSKLSLNDILMVGPIVQQSLYEILLRFRKHRVVFTADIEKMYRQISINQPDTEYQRIVWRETSLAPIEHYRLLTVTYGTASAPYLATKTLITLADEYLHQYPTAAKRIREDFYVDDLMTGAKNQEEAHKLKDEIITIVNSGCFNLRKWTTNCTSLLQSIPVENREISPIEIHEGTRSVKLLGLEWNPKNDSFHFKVSVLPNPSLTKREMLSEASKLFDPLGWLSPSTVMVKILFQSLWLLHLQWDDPLPAVISKKWTSLRDEFKELEKISIPRWLKTNELNFELHGFSDASEYAFSAVIYARTKTKDDTYETRIITAKTKVAPIKYVSIPRLELCAALLLTRLSKTVIQSLQCPSVNLFTWTDSANVLWWLSSHPRTWKSYVANRTSEILETTSRANWRYVPTKENPADCASRGISPSNLNNFDLWWNGPTWLRQPKEAWPNQKNLQHSTDKSENKISEVIEHHADITNQFLEILSKKYSKFTKLVRIIARIFHFFNNLKRSMRDESRENLVTQKEYQLASERIIKWTQLESFAKEIKTINQQKPLPNSSKLVSLNPFLDENGILRVGSRIRNATVQYNTRFPTILPANHIITNLIIDETHIKHFHASQSMMIATLRQKYWIINCKTQVRQHLHKCIPCTRWKATKNSQLMGDLPPERVNFKHAFHQTGVDYAGPIWLKSMTGRRPKPHKAYISIFVCLSSKAVHIELVSDLTTEAFIAALKRFMARRGVSADIFSDNGTNFIGANNVHAEINKLNKSLKHNTLISNFLLGMNTRWHFIPPSAPNFGGLWEAAVKSTKYHLRRVLGNTTLNFEEMTTLLAQIEAVLNSRPLCKLSPDADDALTPAHFLTGQPLTMLPDPDYKPVPQNRLFRWQLVQQLMQHFWARWHTEYLTSLHSRSKWQHKHKNLMINDIVLIRVDNTRPANWPLGRIIELHPGKDGVVRVVTIRTQSGTYKRTVTKLVLLPIC